MNIWSEWKCCLAIILERRRRQVTGLHCVEWGEVRRSDKCHVNPDMRVGKKKLHIPHSHTMKLDNNYFISPSCVFHHFMFPVSNVTRKSSPSQVIQSSFFTIKMGIYPFLTCATEEREKGRKSRRVSSTESIKYSNQIQILHRSSEGLRTRNASFFSRQEENSGIRRPFAELSTDFPLLNFLIRQTKLKFNWIKGKKKEKLQLKLILLSLSTQQSLELNVHHSLCEGIFAERIRHGGWWAQNKKLLKVCFANKTSKSKEIFANSQKKKTSKHSNPPVTVPPALFLIMMMENSTFFRKAV